MKLEDVIVSLTYRYFDADAENYLEQNPKTLNKIWTHTDSQAYGRCFSMVPALDHIKLGIQEIEIVVTSQVTVYLHTPENFITSKPNTNRLVKLPNLVGYWYVYEVKHDLINMVDDGKTCSSHPNYSIDMCANNEVERKAIEDFGCTSPYGSNKTKICQDPDMISNVMVIYTNKVEKYHHKCLNPCSFHSIMKISWDEQIMLVPGKGVWGKPEKANKSSIKIQFKENIKVTTGYYLYTGLSLFAEIGGCIGLGRTIVWVYGKSLNFGEKLKLI